MATTSCKYRPVGNPDSITKIARYGTLVDDLSYQRSAEFPREPSLASRKKSGETSIVLGKCDLPKESLYRAQFTPQDIDVNQGESRRNIVRAMLNKNFVFSANEHSPNQFLSEYRDELHRHPSTSYLKGNTNILNHSAIKTNVYLGNEPFERASTSMVTYTTPQTLPELETLRVSTGQETKLQSPPFTLGSDTNKWTTEQSSQFAKHPTTFTVGSKKLIRLDASNPLNDTISVPGIYATTTSSVYIDHTGNAQPLRQYRLHNQNIHLGYEARECKTTYRGDYKDIEYVQAQSKADVHSDCKKQTRPDHLMRFPRKMDQLNKSEFVQKSFSLEAKQFPWLN